MIERLICAQPKSGSTSLMRAVAQLSGLSCGQQFTLGRLPLRLHERALRRIGTAALGLVADRLLLTTKEWGYERLRDLFPAAGWEALAAAHSDVADFREGAEAPFAYQVHKQHFPPTEANLRRFRRARKVVLVRDVGETMASYLRVSRAGPESDRLKTILGEDAAFRARLADEIRRWREGWIAEAEAHGGLVLEFEDLKRDPAGAVRRVLAALAIEAETPEGYVLPRERYYRG